MDRALVEMALSHTSTNEVEAHLEEVLGEAPYMGGWDDVSVVWLDQGTRFMIEEYDGRESILTLDDLTLTA